MNRLKDMEPETAAVLGAAIGLVVILLAYFKPEWITKLMFGY